MISVCIPTYNQALYLESCINSILMQTKQPDEIIISDDCSTDNTKQILNRLSNNKLLKIIYQPINVGITQNINACFKLAAGDYIVRVDSDDILLPNYISEMSGLLDKYPNAGYAHCAIQEIDEQGKTLKERKLHRSKIFENDKEALLSSLKGYKVAANILMFRKEALQQTELINCTYNFAEDYYLATDIAAQGFGNVYNPKILANYRVWKDAKNVRIRRKLEEIKGLTSVFEEVIEPAFKARMYKENLITQAKTRFAKAQADCLSWTVFNAHEKHLLKDALLVLSSSAGAKSTYYLYEHNLQALPNAFKKAKNTTKRLIKAITGRFLANN